ncbi:MAG: hypothetical protein KGP01_01895 [Actinomycetales bacterium]|nr:hypothetical protein [Actinomycetales bacterium]
MTEHDDNDGTSPSSQSEPGDGAAGLSARSRVTEGFEGDGVPEPSATTSVADAAIDGSAKPSAASVVLDADAMARQEAAERATGSAVVETGSTSGAGEGAPAFSDEQVTGEPRVDAALAQLHGIDPNSPSEAVGQLAQVYERLQRVLSEP